MNVVSFRDFLKSLSYFLLELNDCPPRAECIPPLYHPVSSTSLQWGRFSEDAAVHLWAHVYTQYSHHVSEGQFCLQWMFWKCLWSETYAEDFKDLLRILDFTVTDTES